MVEILKVQVLKTNFYYPVAHKDSCIINFIGLLNAIWKYAYCVGLGHFFVTFVCYFSIMLSSIRCKIIKLETQNC